MSSRINNSLLDFKSLDTQSIELIFSVADQLSKSNSFPQMGFRKTGALLFFEPSTRTRLSFETACARLGIHPLLLESKSGSSLEKGESIEDTILNVAAMSPSFLVIRCGDNLDLRDIAQQISMPAVNAGWGQQGHPTQALLDAYTIKKNFGSCQGQKVLVVGDSKHSRVASSHFELASKLGYEVALCGPNDFLPTTSNLKIFSSLSEGLSWATVAMALRVQGERHQKTIPLDKYRQQFGLTQQSLCSLSKNALILHPGPINQGIEMDADVLRDSRCRVLEQVANGVLIRQSVIQQIMSRENE